MRTHLSFFLLFAAASFVSAVPDCNGDEGGTALTDLCGTCCAGNTGVTCGTVLDCAGNCNSGATRDECGNCVLGEGEQCNCNNIGQECRKNCGGSTSCITLCAALQGICQTTCDANIVKDCLGVCDGTAVEDCAGTCEGTAVEDCAGVCDGTAVQDCAGVCDGTAVQDCAGTCGGNAVQDCLGVCGGTAVEDCAGVCEGTAVEDCLGVCEGTTPDEACTDFCTVQYLGLPKGLLCLCIDYCDTLDCPSTDNGDCDKCKGGVTSLTLRYNGASDAVVEVRDTVDIYFDATVLSNATFSFQGTKDDGKFQKNSLTVSIDGEPDTSIHVSCSQPIQPGLVFGSFTIEEAVSKDNGNVCALDEEDDDEEMTDKDRKKACEKAGKKFAKQLEKQFDLPKKSVDPDDGCKDTDGDGVPDFQSRNRGKDVKSGADALNPKFGFP